MTFVTGSAQAPVLFGGVHLSLLGISLLLAALTVWGVRRLRGTEAQGSLIRTAGWVMLAGSVAYTLWMMLPENWSLGNSLPLHYSDALRFISAVALIWQPRWAIAICYYWGLTLNLQAMVTPHPSMLIAPSVGVIFYWSLHVLVLLTPLALIWGVGHRPGWEDCLVAYSAAIGWAGLAMAINAVLGTNYGFLNHPPEGASLIDVLGPWPSYVFWLMVLAALLWALMTLPWTVNRTARHQGTGSGGAQPH